MSVSTDDANESGRVHIDGHADGQSHMFMAGRDIHHTAYASPPPSPEPTLHTLPRDVAVFTGRDSELHQLLDASSGGWARATSIHVVDGMPGVGKTSLAVHAGHLLADRHPDGQLFIRLHAHTPGQSPADPAELLATLLTSLGLASRSLPQGLEARSALWRDRLRSKRMLLILDDAADADQVEPLLPASASCRVLITSRQRLIGLEGAFPLSLATLPAEQAVELFLRLAHRSPTGPDSQAAAEAVRLCGYLPLAISLLASRLAHHPAWNIVEFTRHFAAAQDRLGELAGGSRAVAAAFDLSYLDLPPNRRRFFRRLSYHPGPYPDAYAAAALDGISLDEARRQLEALYMDHLLEEVAPGRYRLHDLLRRYAHSLPGRDDMDQVLERVLVYYQHTAATADRHLRSPLGSGSTTPPLPSPVPDPIVAPKLNDDESALAWMRAALINVLPCVSHAINHEQHARVIQLASVMAFFLEQEPGAKHAARLQEAAVDAAQHLGDRLAEASALQHLFKARCALGNYPAACDAVERALELYRALDDRLGEADALHHSGMARRLTGDYPAAADLAQQALNAYRALGNRTGEARALQALSWIQQVVFQNLKAAAGLAEQAIALHRALGDRHGEAHVLAALCVVRREAGQNRQAAEAAEQAVKLNRALGNQHGQARALNSLSRVRSVLGGYGRAGELAQQALELYRALGDRHGEAEALQALAVVRRAHQEHQAAAELAQQALQLYRALKFRHGEANALAALGQARHLAGHHKDAIDLLQQAQALFEQFEDHHGKAETLNSIGGVLSGTARPQDALASHQHALSLARLVRAPLEEARALEGSAHCQELAGHHAAAMASLQEAVAIYHRIEAAEAAPAAAHLAALKQH